MAWAATVLVDSCKDDSTTAPITMTRVRAKVERKAYLAALATTFSIFGMLQISFVQLGTLSSWIFPGAKVGANEALAVRGLAQPSVAP